MNIPNPFALIHNLTMSHFAYVIIITRTAIVSRIRPFLYRCLLCDRAYLVAYCRLRYFH
ncbi:hypothetical protein CPB83DRAFT_841937 [Crepidotus variabilis]|uniref:Uncharacterized protein n=1 Tax=Crepidotus variabilis TaxID=179855 RepID=A0A9P6EUE1_9AGAR|nr:hypothetical protein CPB83DRAFT_841937 [Crepidotus variabilis]